jgi:hypothetical protein
MIKVISLGWGIQSWTLVAMSALGEIEKVDYAIHADTTHERNATYIFAKHNTAWLENRGIKVVTVKASNPILVDKWGGVMIPAHAENKGIVHRQCTGKWKIMEIRRWLQANRNKQPVEQWIGISLDEYQRMKPSNVKYITNRWPLIEKKMTRNDCVLWLRNHGLQVPNKSACVFCPFQNTTEWRQVKNNRADWEQAIEADNSIREARMPGRLFVHPARVPLGEVDLQTEQEKGQLELWDNECFGVCGV